MVDPKLEQFKSRFWVAERKIIDAPVLWRGSGSLASPRKRGEVKRVASLIDTAS
jgi:hypothetical protein